MKNVKRYLSIFMVIAMIIVMTAACGGKEEANGSDGSETAETGASDVESEPEAGAEDVQAEAPADETEGQGEALSEKELLRQQIEARGETIDTDYDPVDVLGIPAEKIQELFGAVKNAITEEYLTKYNISPADFQWPENGTGDAPAPWSYLENKLAKKVIYLDSDRTDEPEEEPSMYNLDEQTADLMNSMYNATVNWIASNQEYVSMLLAAQWMVIFTQNVTFE